MVLVGWRGSFTPFCEVFGREIVPFYMHKNTVCRVKPLTLSWLGMHTNAGRICRRMGLWWISSDSREAFCKVNSKELPVEDHIAKKLTIRRLLLNTESRRCKGFLFHPWWMRRREDTGIILCGLCLLQEEKNSVSLCLRGQRNHLWIVIPKRRKIHWCSGPFKEQNGLNIHFCTKTLYFCVPFRKKRFSFAPRNLRRLSTKGIY